MTSDTPAKKAPTKKAATKKAEKKATKRTQQKNLEAAGDILAGAKSRTSRTLSESSTVAEIDAAAKADGVPVLDGAATVRLVFSLPDAITPVDAVRQTMYELAMNGLRAYTFIVTDEHDGETWLVTGEGEILERDAED